MYIATQAPLPVTFADFFRMIWENSSKCIVTLTDLEEGGKVHFDLSESDSLGSSEQVSTRRNEHSQSIW